MYVYVLIFHCDAHCLPLSFLKHSKNKNNMKTGFIFCSLWISRVPCLWT